MKILITGSSGQLGYHLKQAFNTHELYLGTSQNFDVTKRDLVLAETEKFRPDVIVHAAAFTNVDKAEIEKERCQAVNVLGTKHVAEAAVRAGAKLVAFSTDYVFDGTKGAPYTEEDSPNPLSYYGQTKYEAEQVIQQIARQYFICRTSWLYGGPRPTGDFNLSDTSYKNFVCAMLRIGKGKEGIEVVDDQVGGPTYAKDLAETTTRLIATNRFGTYHLTNAGATSWADFATKIFELASYRTTVKHITTAEWLAARPQTAKRPAYSVLANYELAKAGLPPLRDWQTALAEFLGDPQSDSEISGSQPSLG